MLCHHHIGLAWTSGHLLQCLVTQILLMHRHRARINVVLSNRNFYGLNLHASWNSQCAPTKRTLFKSKWPIFPQFSTPFMILLRYVYYTHVSTNTHILKLSTVLWMREIFLVMAVNQCKGKMQKEPQENQNSSGLTFLVIIIIVINEYNGMCF